MNKWMSSSVIFLLCASNLGCVEEDKYTKWGETLSSNNINAFTQQNPTGGGIMNELTLSKLKLAEMNSDDRVTEESIALIKQTIMSYNSVVLEFDKRKKAHGGSLEANEALLDEISLAKAGMSHNELSIAVRDAMQELDSM